MSNTSGASTVFKMRDVATVKSMVMIHTYLTPLLAQQSAFMYTLLMQEFHFAPQPHLEMMKKIKLVRILLYVPIPASKVRLVQVPQRTQLAGLYLPRCVSTFCHFPQVSVYHVLVYFSMVGG